MNDQHGGLRIGAVAGVGASEETKIHNRWTCTDEVTNYLTMELGMALAKEPNYACPELTVEDLTTPDSQAYTEIYAKRTAWFGFLSERKAEHDAVVIEIEAEMEDIETNIRDSIRKNNKRTNRSGETKNVPASEMEDAINLSPRYVELKQKLVFHREVLVRLNARVEKLDRELRLTSRQVEIRRLDFDTSQRQANLGGRSGGPPRGMGYPGGRQG
jgi:hypothetical protein